MQDDDLRERPPDDQQRLDQLGQVGEVRDQLLMTCGTSPCRLFQTLRPKLRNVPRRSFSMAMAFDCSGLQWVGRRAQFLAP